MTMQWQSNMPGIDPKLYPTSRKYDPVNNPPSGVMSSGPSLLLRAQSHSAYSFLNYCFVYPLVPQVEQPHILNQPLPPIEESKLNADTKLEEETIQNVMEQRQKQKEREELKKHLSTQSKERENEDGGDDEDEEEEGGDDRMSESDSNANANDNSNENDKIPYFPEENFGDVNKLGSLEKQSSLSDDILLSCDQDEQMSIWLQLEEEKRNKMILNEEREALSKMSVPIPEDTLTVEQQQMIFDFMDKTSFEDTSIIYGFLLQAKWDLQAALAQFHSIKHEFEEKLKKRDVYSKHEEITDID